MCDYQSHLTMASRRVVLEFLCAFPAFKHRLELLGHRQGLIEHLLEVAEKESEICNADFLFNTLFAAPSLVKPSDAWRDVQLLSQSSPLTPEQAFQAFCEHRRLGGSRGVSRAWKSLCADVQRRAKLVFGLASDQGAAVEALQQLTMAVHDVGALVKSSSPETRRSSAPTPPASGFPPAAAEAALPPQTPDQQAIPSSKTDGGHSVQIVRSLPVAPAFDSETDF